MNTVYQMLINNVANYIVGEENTKLPEGQKLTAFTASDVLSVALCKSKEEIIMDIVIASKNVLG